MHAVGTTAWMHLQGFLSRILKLHLRFFPAAVPQPFLQKIFSLPWLSPGVRQSGGSTAALVLLGQLIKLVQVASTSELHENQPNDLLFFEIVPCHF